ncbi:hypothetical protein F8M41_003543 [Gigaspora margarita]|uniref:Uncharacterized protein n=1 Tax=Gigaspora margarita TaxID=4874 RepID=A0A8H4AY82_GIGMA|nr:hypothetical protein F8M41_003543 [Gigaspora margarita]
MASKNWKPSSRPSTYVRGSKRTKRCKKVEQKKAAQDTRLITTYFAPTLICESSIELHASIEVKSIEMELIEMELVDVESVELVEVELVEMEPIEMDKRTKMRLAIEELDGC